MKTLAEIDTQNVSGGTQSSEILTSTAGAIIGACTASKLLAGVNVYWLGIFSAPYVLAGAFLGATVAHTIYSLDEYIITATLNNVITTS